MTPARIGTRQSLVFWTTCTLVALAQFACIDVGHDAETGCLVDRTLPGCHPPEDESAGEAGAPAQTLEEEPSEEQNRGEGGSAGTLLNTTSEAGSAGEITAGAAGARGQDPGAAGWGGLTAH